MQTEALVTGLFVLLVCGAVSFYLYVRLAYTEKKLTVMESILVDLKVAFDSLISEHVHRNAPSPTPITQTPGVELSTPVPLEPSESENVPAVPEEQFYTSILEQAHENVAETTGGEQVVVEANPNFDTMSRADLSALAEKKGLRVKKSMSRETILNLLRRSDKSPNEGLTTGAENIPGSNGTTFQSGASLDGSLPTDGISEATI
jgi:hypothetical protein